MKSMFRGIGKAAALAFGLTIINCILLVASFCLPTEAMRDNVGKSTALIDEEAMYFRWNEAYTTTQVDGQSEYDLYGMAINEDAEGSVIEQAMFMWYPDGENLPRNLGIAAYGRKDDIHFDQRPYTRYWNGSVMFLKLLLLKFTIPDIRMINYFVQMMLLLLIIWLMAKNKMTGYFLPFAAGMMIINPFTMALSVKYSSEYYPMLLSIIAILALGDRIEKLRDGWCILFAITGAVTAFMCMLSFPGIALGMPLLFLIWRNKCTDMLKTIVQMSLCWGVAYAVAWSMKWIIGTLTTSYNFLADAIYQVFKYQGDNTASASTIDRLKQTLWCISNPVYTMFFVAVILITVLITYRMVRQGKDLSRSDASDSVWKQIVSYGIIAIIPLVIILGLGNGYAYVHAYMAHRQYAISVTAGLCIIELITEYITGKKKY